jgi:hypothetical protein
MKSMLNGPFVSPAPEVSRAVRGVIVRGSGHDGVMGTTSEEVVKPNMNPDIQFEGERRCGIYCT